MAECSGDCSSYTPDTSTKWFKIDEQGIVNGAWAQAALDTGAPANVTIPENLKAGNYLLRHELIALQGAQAEGGAEFYPSCVQMTIGGSGTGTPSTTVSFPGAYSASDPGILVDVRPALVFCEMVVRTNVIKPGVRQSVDLCFPRRPSRDYQWKWLGLRFVVFF